MIKIGSHVSFGKEQLLTSTKEAVSYGANTFMFYTGAPTNTVRKEIEQKYIDEANKLMQENGIDVNDVVCHAPYIVNLGNASDEDKYNFSINFIRNELKRCDAMGITKMVLHPGNATGGLSKQEGLDNIVNAINTILDGTSKCKILLETMAGKGTECGNSKEEIAYMINNINKKDQIGICLDTCHLSDSGVDVTNLDTYLDELEKLINLSYIGCVHVNDSKNEMGAKKDRHANLGDGYIGFDTILSIIYNPRLSHLPFILETPYIGDTDDAKERLYPPYKYEIEMIRNKKYDPAFKEKIRNEYKK
jgi:deoxyribonuclease-4